MIYTSFKRGRKVLDTRFLDTLAAVVSYGSIAETAREKNLTPAAVAQRIRTLEQESIRARRAGRDRLSHLGPCIPAG